MAQDSIKKIEEIKNVRSFLNFSSDAEFGKKNIIYAPNGTGKTNLSNFLKYISDKELDLNELKSLEAAESPIEFKLLLKDDSQIDHNNYFSLNLERILVYNSEYIENSVRSNDFSDKEIDGELDVELGPEQKELSEKIKELDLLEEESKKEKEELEAKLEGRKFEIKKLHPRGDRTIVELDYLNLTKQRYEEVLLLKESDEEVGREGWLNSEEAFNDNKDLDPDRDSLTFDLKELKIDEIGFEWIKEKLDQEISFTELPEGDLKQHLEKISNDWVQSGLEYHSVNETHCPFCLQKMSEESKELIEKYKSHIDSKKAKFEKQINVESMNVSSVIVDLEKINNNVKAQFDIRVRTLNMDESWNHIDSLSVIEQLKDLQKKLVQKKEKPKIKIKIEKDYFEKIGDSLSIVNKNIGLNHNNIDKVNKKILNLSVRQGELRKLLGLKYFVMFYESNKPAIEKQLQRQDSMKVIKNEIDVIKKTIPSKDAAIKIIELFNIFIAQIGIKKYKAELVEGKIILKLKETYDISNKARNILSEGEKNGIALSFFFASSIRRIKNPENLSNSIFVIDDPICSMSYKYFYGVCDLLKTFQKTISKVALRGQDSLESPQIIILTHNIQFYNMLFSNIFRKEEGENDIVYFELRNENDQHILENNTHHKISEYKTALKRVKDYSTGANDENIGNDLRRILETLCSFHGYVLNRENVSKILEGANGSLLSFAHDFSHEDLGSYEDPRSEEEYKEIASHFIGLMESSYPEILKNI